MGEVVTTGMVEVITVGYFVHAGIEAFAIENISVNMGFDLYSEEAAAELCGKLAM